ncbi:MAG: circadian clock KaiB family protein [Bacteroidota bacterium]|nr:circadian clock KaiB family protein [Bacteroidota bacterium]
MERVTNGPVPNVASTDPGRYLLRLYIAGPTTTSTRAIVNIRTLCEEYLSGRYDLEVIDLSIDPKAAAQDHIISLPTLLKIQPDPLKRLIGDMSNTNRVLSGLGIDPLSVQH